MNPHQHQYQSNNSFSFDNPCTNNHQIIPQKEIKQINTSQFDSFSNNNQPQLLQQASPDIHIQPLQSQSEYIQELEAKIVFLQSQNAELQANYVAVSSMLENERKDFQTKILTAVKETEMKYCEDNKNLQNQIEELKLKNNLQKTNTTILLSEKDRKLEQNKIDKEYYDKIIASQQKEIEALKNEIKDKAKNFSSIINKQQQTMGQDKKMQVKNYKEMLNRSEKEKKDIIKKYESKLHELQVKINRLEQGDYNIRSKSKGKLTPSANITLSTNFSPISNRIRPNSRSNSKSKGKQITFNGNYCTSHNNRLGRSESNTSCSIKGVKEGKGKMIHSGSFSNFGCLKSINDAIHSLERNIAELTLNYKNTADKLNKCSGQEEINALNQNLMFIQNDIDEQTEQLSLMKLKQQQYLQKGYMI